MPKDSITVDGVTYYKTVQPMNSKIKIVILQRGWVAIGNFERKGNDCKLTNASVIRVWGTTKGLGEIALNGPTNETILDKCGDLEFDYLTCVAVMSVNEDKWSL